MTAAVSTARPGGVRTRLAPPALALAYGAAATAIAVRAGPDTTYGATSTAALAADLAAGLGLIAAGAITWLVRRGGSTAPVTALLGAVWLAPDAVGWEGGPALVRSLGLVAGPLLLPLLVHLVLALPTGRLASRAERVAVATVYGAAAAFSVGRALVRDPFLDPDCWSNCTDNVFLVSADQDLARALERGWFIGTACVGAATVAVVLWRLLSTTRAGRTAFWPVLVPAAVAAGGATAYAVALLRDAEDPNATLFQAVFFVRATAFACLAAGVAWTVLRAWRTRSAISRLAVDLGQARVPDSLQTVLALSLGDDGLEVAYWLPGPKRYVDGNGRPVEPPAGRDRTSTPIVRRGEPVALVVHDRALSGARDLEREIGAAARLAVDNERLRAELLAQLEDLRASRSRIVETADSARRRLERDLHDGAQQRLLAISYELRLARAAAAADGDDELGAVLAASSEEAQRILEELRDVAHGIYPAILTEAGLGPALLTLADTAPLPVEIEAVPDERFAEAVERSVYVVVSGAVEAAARAGVDHAAVTVERDGDALVVGVSQADTAPSAHLADRVGALGGHVSVEGGMLRAEIPCA